MSKRFTVDYDIEDDYNIVILGGFEGEEMIYREVWEPANILTFFRMPDVPNYFKSSEESVIKDALINGDIDASEVREIREQINNLIEIAKDIILRN